MMGMPQITSLTPSIWDAMTKYFMVHALLKKKRNVFLTVLAVETFKVKAPAEWVSGRGPFHRWSLLMVSVDNEKG